MAKLKNRRIRSDTICIKLYFIQIRQEMNL